MKYNNMSKKPFKVIGLLIFVLLSYPYKTSVKSGNCDFAYANTIPGLGLCICPGGSFKFPIAAAAVWSPIAGPLPDPNGGPCQGCDDCFYMLPIEFDQYCQEWNPALVKCHAFNREVGKNARQPINLSSPASQQKMPLNAEKFKK